MGYTKEQRIVNSVTGTTKAQINNGTEISPTGSFNIPNKSGDHYRSYKRQTPVRDIDLVNKKYVDDNFLSNAGDTGTGNYTFNGTALNLTGASPKLKVEDIGGNYPALDLKNTSQHWRMQVNADSKELYFSDLTAEPDQHPFVIEAGAATNTLVVDSNSRVGIGTSAPSQKFHINHSGSDNLFRIENTDNRYPGFQIITDTAGTAEQYFLQLNTGGDIYFYNTATRLKIYKAGNVDVVGAFTAGTIQADNGATGSFTTADGKTVTVVGGVITSIV